MGGVGGRNHAVIDVLYRDNKKTIAMNISNTGHMIATKIEYGINFFFIDRFHWCNLWCISNLITCN